MAVVQTKIFRSTQPYSSDPEDMNRVCDSLQYEVNAFLATLAPQNVLAVETHITPVGKYGGSVHYHLVVTYLQ